MKYLKYIFLFNLYFSSHFSQLFSESSLQLILDNSSSQGELANWRTSEEYALYGNATFSTKGLEEIHISGSGQFSETNFFTILGNIPVDPTKLFVIDLREESHGLINHQPVSWTDGVYNNPNSHLQMDEIELDEWERLKEVAENGRIVINASKEATTFFVESVKTERELLESLGVTYIRFPVSDHQRPSDEIVDQFLFLIKNLSSDKWIHFHCKAGRGRTTTFMVLYDIFKNGKEVSLEDILARQECLGGSDLTNFIKDSELKNMHSKERLEFIEKFYIYCREVPNFDLAWSNWIKTQS